MENGEATETIAIGAGGVLFATAVIVGLVWGRNGQAVLYAALLLLALLSPVVIWIFVRRARRAALRPATESLKLILKKARETTANEKPGALPHRGWNSPEREQERNRLLDRFDESLKVGLRARSINEREEQLDGAVAKGLEYLVCVQRQRAEVLLEESKEVLQSTVIPKEAETVELLLRVQDLASSAKRELDSTKPIPGRFVQPADKALERARQPLADAMATANGVGLLVGSSVLDGSESNELESLFSVAAKMLTVTRRLQPE